jgi:hypothetical protein
MNGIRSIAIAAVCAVMTALPVRAAPLSHQQPVWTWTRWWEAEASRSHGSAGTAALPSTPAATDSRDTLASASTSASSANVVVAPSYTQTISNVPSPADALVLMTSGPFPDASGLTTGAPEPWYLSPSVIHVFGGVPNLQQQAAFTQAVLNDVEHTFQLSGMSPTITTNPYLPALHTISVVSNTSDPSNPGAIGITDVGANGFGFIDQLHYAQTPAELAWAISHNVAHELMHAFGIGSHPDQTGKFIDAGTTTWALLTSPSAQFSPSATQSLLASQYGALSGSSGAHVSAELLNPASTKVDGDEVLPQAVAEPASAAIWVVAVMTCLGLMGRRIAAHGRNPACQPRLVGRN